MPRHRANSSDSAPGSDSFLDIVANMVGVLIILVMVVGVQAKDAFLAPPVEEDALAAEQSQPAEPTVEAIDKNEITQQQWRVGKLKGEVQSLVTTTGGLQQEAKSRFALRNKLQQMTLAAEQLIDQERANLDDAQQQDFDLRRSLQSARDELEDLSMARLAVENTSAPVVQLKHLPTPMAKTVFGQEEHYRLSGGRLAYVPMNQLVEEMKQQAKLKIYKLEQSPRVTEIVGPIGGFTLKYQLVRRKVTFNTDGGPVVRDGVDLAGFVLVPFSENLGEPVDDALTDGSQFLTHLRQFDANTTTITIWTYPNSFADFRRVKDKLYDLGYLTAGRPLPEGHPIGGSPQGARSGAQ